MYKCSRKNFFIYITNLGYKQIKYMKTRANIQIKRVYIYQAIH